MTKHKLRLAFGASLSNFTEKNVKQMVEMGATELILTANGSGCPGGSLDIDLKPYPEFVTLAHQNGCKAGYDMECAIWANKGQYINLSTPYYQDKFRDIKSAGYDFAISEGLIGDMPVQIKKSGLPYYNMGGEGGENMYTSLHYAHPSDSHDANYMEAYHSWAKENYFETAKDYHSKCKNFGLTFQLYSVPGNLSDLETDHNAMLEFMDRLEGVGVYIGTVHFWAGIDAVPFFNRLQDAKFYQLYEALKDEYGFTGH